MPLRRANGLHTVVNASRTADPGDARAAGCWTPLLTLIGFTFVVAACGWGAQEVGLPLLVTQQAGLSVQWLAVAYACNTGVIVLAQVFVINRGRAARAPASSRGWG